jgi:HD-GYP domain-containing protein (c-di-GMP phosphodiesterase class II)
MTEILKLPQTQTLLEIKQIDSQFEEAFKNYPWIGTILNRLYSHSDWTYDHSLRVGFIAKELTLADDDKSLTSRAGVGHDIGKLNIPPSVLDHPRNLDITQRDLMDKHPEDGFLMLKENNDSRAAEIMVAHHEWQDRPYPRKTPRFSKAYIGRKEFLQQILALSDGVDALRSDRPYKKGWEYQETLDFLSPKFGEGPVISALEIYQRIH